MGDDIHEELKRVLEAEMSVDMRFDNLERISFGDDIKDSLAYQYDWANLLQPAPLAVLGINSCLVASFSDVARETQLPQLE